MEQFEEKTRKDLLKIKTCLINSLKLNGVSPKDFVYGYNPNSGKVLDAVLSEMAKTFDDVTFHIAENQLAILVKNLEDNPVDNALLNLFYDLKDVYYKFDGCKVVKRDISFFPELPNFSYTDEKVDKYYRLHIRNMIFAEGIPLLILPSGKVYRAEDYHKNLCNWLIMSGENVLDAVRLNVYYKNNGHISMSSTEVFSSEWFSRGVELTDEQIKALNKIYNVSIWNNKNFKQLEECFYNYSEGLGFDEESLHIASKTKPSISVTEYNLKQLVYCMRGIDIKKISKNLLKMFGPDFANVERLTESGEDE